MYSTPCISPLSSKKPTLFETFPCETAELNSKQILTHYWRIEGWGLLTSMGNSAFGGFSEDKRQIVQHKNWIQERWGVLLEIHPQFHSHISGSLPEDTDGHLKDISFHMRTKYRAGLWFSWEQTQAITEILRTSLPLADACLGKNK